MKKTAELEKKLGLRFKDKSLLSQALCHRSYLNENPDFGFPHNERLEFLGDAVLELAVTQWLFQKYPQQPEGELTNWRAALVNAKMLSRVAQELDLSEFLLLSRGEQSEKGKARLYILANALEALIGAIYLDQGFSKCQGFVEKHLLGRLEKIVEKGLFRDPKSRFQEEAQERMKNTPFYEVLEESGPDHQKHFVVAVFLEREMIAKGEGSSKQEAEEMAAQGALELKGW